MDLAVDVGNSRIKFGMFDSTETGSETLPCCARTLAIGIDMPIPWTEIHGWFPPRSEVAGIVAGSNPVGVRRMLAEWPADWSVARVLDDPREVPLPIDLPEPGKIGIDRLLNAVAANVLRPANRAAIIVDTGTATTVDFVSSAGTFQGGAILPGFQLSARALNRYTALLPLIGIDELSDDPPSPLGRDTREALRSGLFWGQLGAVRELIARLSGDDESPAVFLTGGGGPLLTPHLPDARYEPHLALQGLMRAATSLRNDPS